MDTTTLAGKRDRALILVGFDSALRRSELTAIKVAHLDRQKKGLLIDIPHSKTDQEGDGAMVAVLARPTSPYCPVSALDDWLMAARVTDGYLFRRIFRNGTIGTTALTGRSVSLVIKQRATKAGYTNSESQRFSGHSLRRGFITSAATAGVHLTPIMKQTRHRKTESVVGYVEVADLLSHHPGKTLLTNKID